MPLDFGAFAAAARAADVLEPGLRVGLRLRVAGVAVRVRAAGRGPRALRALPRAAPARALAGPQARVNRGCRPSVEFLGLYQQGALSELRDLPPTCACWRSRAPRSWTRSTRSRLPSLTRLKVANCGDIASLAPLRGLDRARGVLRAGSRRGSLDGDLSVLLELPRLRELGMRDRREYRPRVSEIEAALARVRVDGASCPAIALHCSHEQIPPSRLLRVVQRAEEAGFDGGMSSDHFAPWSERQGESGLRLVVPRRGAGADLAAVRRRQRAGTALPPGDHRPGRGDAVRDVPGAAVDRARHRRGVQRAHHRRAAGRRRPIRTARLRECVDVMRALFARRGGLARRARGRRPRAAVDAAGDAAAAAVRGGEREDRALGRASGRTGWRRSTRRSSTLRRMLDAFGPDGRKVLQVHVSLGADRRGGAADRPRPVAHERLRPAGLLGPRHARGVRRRPRSSCGPRTCAAQGADLLRPRAARRVAAGVRGARVRRHRAPPRRPGPRRRSSTRSASTSSRRCA